MTAAALSSVLLPQSPAVARPATSHRFHTSTHGLIPPGWTRIEGRITFLGVHRVRLVGTIDDVCPADGVGAYGVLVVELRNGATRERSFTRDNDGCTSAPTEFARTVRFRNRVANAAVAVWQRNGPHGGGQARQTKVRDNPFVD